MLPAPMHLQHLLLEGGFAVNHAGLPLLLAGLAFMTPADVDQAALAGVNVSGPTTAPPTSCDTASSAAAHLDLT